MATTNILNVAALNVHGLARKVNDTSFLNIVNRYDNIGMVETWSSKLSNLNVRGYTLLKEDGIKRGKRGRRSGGVALYFKHKYKPGIHPMTSSSKYNLWVQLDRNFFGLERDLGVIYLRPTDAKTRDIYFDELESDLIKYQAMGDVMLCGDFNARTGEGIDYI